jgi:hypothetical protein
MFSNLRTLRRGIILPLTLAFAVTAGGCFRDPAAPSPPDDDDGKDNPVPTMAGTFTGSGPWIG